MQPGRFLSVLAIAALLVGCRSSGIAFNPPGGRSGGASRVVHVVVAPGLPVNVGYQVGTSGTWKLLCSACTPGTMSFTLNGTDAYGVAMYCSAWDYPAIFQATTPEVDTVNLPQCIGATDVTPASLSGSYDASAFGGATEVDVQQDDVSATGGLPSGSYSVPFPGGTQDVFAEVRNSSDVSSGNYRGIVALKTLQNQTIPASGVAIDFAASDAVGSPETMTWTNIPSNSFFESGVQFGLTSVFAYGGNACAVWLNAFTEVNGLGGGTDVLQYPTVASADVGANDAYYAFADAGVTGHGNAADEYADIFQPSPPTTLALTAPFDLEPNVANTALSLNYTGFSGLSANGEIWGYLLSFAWGSGNYETAAVTSGWVKASGSTNYPVPIVSLTGFPALTPPANSTAVNFSGDAVYVSEIGFSSDVGSIAHSRGAQGGIGGGVGSPCAVITQNSPPTSGTFYRNGALGCFTFGVGNGC